MRYLGLIVAIILILCGVTYYTRQPVIDSTGQPQGADRYTSAINAARGASKFVDAEKRRKWAVTQQMNDYGDQADCRLTYSTDGENSDVLVVTADSADNFLCASLASGKTGTEAAREGFTKLSCRSRSIGTVYEVELKTEN